MKTLGIAASEHETSTSMPVKTHLFALPALLPEQTRVLLDAQSHAAIVFSLSPGDLLSSPHSYP